MFFVGIYKRKEVYVGVTRTLEDSVEKGIFTGIRGRVDD